MIQKLNLGSGDWVSFLKGVGIAAAGAALTYATQHVTNADFGSYTPMVVMVLSVLVNYVRKVITNDVTTTTTPVIN